MANIYKTERLVQYLYHETGVLQSFEVENALQCDAEYQGAYYDLQIAKRALPRVLFAPRQRTIDAILRYSAEMSATV